MTKAVGDILRTACENLQPSSTVNCLELKHVMSNLANSSDYFTEESPVNVTASEHVIESASAVGVAGNATRTVSSHGNKEAIWSQDISKIVVLSVIIFFTIFGRWCKENCTVHTVMGIHNVTDR